MGERCGANSDLLNREGLISSEKPLTYLLQRRTRLPYSHRYRHRHLLALIHSKVDLGLSFLVYSVEAMIYHTGPTFGHHHRILSTKFTSKNCTIKELERWLSS